MWKINLDSVQTCENLRNVCRKYRNKLNIDVYYGRYIVDGCSLLGVVSLVNHTVELWIPKDDEELRNKFIEDIKEIGAYEE